MTYDYLTINFAPVAGLIFLSIFLLANSYLEQKIKNIFFLLIGLEALEALAYSLELWTSTFHTFTYWRILLSALGYTLRIMLVYFIFQLAARNNSQRYAKKIWMLPMLLNTAIAFSAFFTDISYSYTPSNHFKRGPLEFFPYAVLFFYLICILIIVVKDYREQQKFEAIIIFAMVVLMAVSVIWEAMYNVHSLGRTSTVIVTIFYYMFFQTKLYKTDIIEGQQLRMMLERENRIDGPTGVLNKKTFIQLAKQTLEQAQDDSIAFIFLDLDHLKELNDTFGHYMGDIAILDAAGKIQTAFDGEDLIGRFGGDEFCVMLTNISKDVLDVYLGQTLKNLRAQYSNGEQSVFVTASLGASYIAKNNGIRYEDMMQAADEAVYEAKNTGRNRYVLRDITPTNAN